MMEHFAWFITLHNSLNNVILAKCCTRTNKLFLLDGTQDKC